MARLLGPADIRGLAADLNLRPTKTLGQNFVHDANTVRRIVTASGIGDTDVALEIGPGLGSLTLGLLEVAASVIAVELDPVLAATLPTTVAQRAPECSSELTVINQDALTIDANVFPCAPTALVANLPYNVAVPVLLNLLAQLPSLTTVLVMVQLEVADRLAALPGSKIYGVPSVKACYYGTVRKAGNIGRTVFWPEPNVESGLVHIDINPDPPWPLTPEFRRHLFGIVDAAFAQRRKTLRAALAPYSGSPAVAEDLLVAAGIDPKRRGETLSINEFVAIAQARSPQVDQITGDRANPAHL